MRTRSTPTRLERHRLKFIKNGHRGPLLQLDELSPEEKKMVQSELVADVRVVGIDFSNEGDDLAFDRVYLDVLNNWGIACPHPHSSVEPVHSGRAHRCAVCECIIIGDAEAVRKAAP